jgi:nitrite reductase/ring-hydroxylating ferredoxin subunit
MSEERIPLCNAADLVDGGHAVPFDVVHGGKPAAPSRCVSRGCPMRTSIVARHVAMEMDWQPDRFFDDSGQWLLCATHGAVYKPDTGECAGGPCRGGLVKIALSEHDGVVHWHTDWNLQPLTF